MACLPWLSRHLASIAGAIRDVFAAESTANRAGYKAGVEQDMTFDSAAWQESASFRLPQHLPHLCAFVKKGLAALTDPVADLAQTRRSGGISFPACDGAA